MSIRRPPGLTCCICANPFGRGLARRTDRGYRHVEPCRIRRRPFEMEDVEWMAATGECLSMAAVRLGITTAALEQRLRREQRPDLYRRLAAREGDWNNPAVIHRTEKAS